MVKGGILFHNNFFRLLRSRRVCPGQAVLAAEAAKRYCSLIVCFDGQVRFPVVIDKLVKSAIDGLFLAVDVEDAGGCRFARRLRRRARKKKGICRFLF